MLCNSFAHLDRYYLPAHENLGPLRACPGAMAPLSLAGKCRGQKTAADLDNPRPRLNHDPELTSDAVAAIEAGLSNARPAAGLDLPPKDASRKYSCALSLSAASIPT